MARSNTGKARVSIWTKGHDKWLPGLVACPYAGENVAFLRLPFSASPRLCAALIAALLLCLGTASVRADEGERTLSLSLGVGGLELADHSLVGGVVGGDYERGVTDVLWLRASAGLGAYSDAGALAYSGHATLGARYVLDILKYVPYADLGLGGIYVLGEDIEEPLQPLLQVGVGLDILTERTRSYGVFARFESFLSRTAFFSVGARMSWRSGFF